MPQKAPWGETRIEVLALADEIAKRVKQGLPIRKIYKELADAGRIKMAERSFYRWVKEIRATSRPHQPAGTPSASMKPVKSHPSFPSPQTTDASLRPLPFTGAAVEEDLWNGGTLDATAELPAIHPHQEEPSDGTD